MLVVYWIDPETRQAYYQEFGDEELSKALDACSTLRHAKMLCVTTVSHDPTPGGIVKDGKLPNGESYTWKKRRL